jgi:hypothetical protein
MARFKFCPVVFVVLCIVSFGAIFRIGQLDARIADEYEKTRHMQDLLIMASQAMDLEMRVRVVEQAKFEGNTDRIRSLSWEFVHELPRYQNFEGSRPVVLAAYK